MADGLFGPSPWEIQQAQQQAMVQNAAAYARMNAAERSVSGMYQAGGMLGGMAAGALGGKNVAVENAQRNEQELSGIDTQTPESILKIAQQVTDPRVKFQLMQLAQKRQSELAEIAHKNAQATRALTGPRDYEYESMMEILNDPDSTDDQKKQAQARIDALNAKKSGSGNSQSVQVKNMVIDGKPVTVRMEKGIGGKVEVVKQDGTVMTPAEYSPELKAKLAQGGASGKVIGEAGGKATVDLIDAVPTAEMQIKQLDALVSHPGLAGAVGVGLPYANKVPGSKEADFAARFEQIKGGVFLQAFNSLRGGGQITESEGSKATAALLRAQYAQSEVEFKEAVQEYIGYIKTGLDRLRKKSNLRTSDVPAFAPAAPAPQSAGNTPPMPGGVTTPQQVKSLYQSGKLSKQQANAILDDMKLRGVF
jgi:hypothetical protein